MKKIITFFIIALFVIPAISFAQTTPGWEQMKDFHNYMAATFHPAEEGNLDPLKKKVDSMYASAKNWAASPVPATFKEKETTIELANLVKGISDIQVAIKSGASDSDLMKMISSAHDIYHKISGECRKEEK